MSMVCKPWSIKKILPYSESITLVIFAKIIKTSSMILIHLFISINLIIFQKTIVLFS